ncbi:MAG: hypothetical protein JKX97_08755 [Candidatus Lindowbacteria bacterium]|nr:hypothetical protein [Candidatus Lindowbacteria bacterium]
MSIAWFVLSADALIKLGRTDEAEALLLSKGFEGKEDCARLARLALLVAKENLHQSWIYLSEATDLDPIFSRSDS